MKIKKELNFYIYLCAHFSFGVIPVLDVGQVGIHPNTMLLLDPPFQLGSFVPSIRYEIKFGGRKSALGLGLESCAQI